MPAFVCCHLSFFAFCSDRGVRSWYCFLLRFGFLLFWCGTSTYIFLFSCCFLCVLRNSKRTRASKLFEWLARIDGEEEDDDDGGGGSCGDDRAFCKFWCCSVVARYAMRSFQI
jgi:hypothetical protein